MLCGGVACLVVAAVTGEFGGLHRYEFTAHAWLAFGYLTVFGSIIAYTAYIWLLRNAELSLVTTYAFVNPVVAVILGSLVLNEAFTLRSAVATFAVVAGVVLMLLRIPARPVPPELPAPAPDEVHA